MGHMAACVLRCQHNLERSTGPRHRPGMPAGEPGERLEGIWSSEGKGGGSASMQVEMPRSCSLQCMACAWRANGENKTGMYSSQTRAQG